MTGSSKKRELETDWRKRFNDTNFVTVEMVPTPTRYFEVGDECQFGNLKDCVVGEVLYDGKAYRIDCVSVNTNYGKTIETPTVRYAWWYDVDSRFVRDQHASEMFVKYLPGQVVTSSIDSLFHIMSHSGLVCDPRYQRGYVWTEEDQHALIDSIFNRMNIGSLIFSRHSGYLHKDKNETVTYINLDGDEIQVPREKDYTNAVIDGQQRVTTLWRFFTNKFPYRGVYYSDLHPHDRGEFNSTSISYRQFDEDDVPYKDVLRMFIQINRGVPQDESHLDKVKKQLDELTNE